MGEKKRMTRDRQAAIKSKSRRKRGRKRSQSYRSVLMLGGVMVALLVVAVTAIIIAPKRNHTVIINHPTLARDVEIAAPPLDTDMSAQILRINPTEVPEEPTATPEPEPTAQPTEAPVTLAVEASAQTAAFEYLPVYKKGDTFERKIAITVDDCFQVDNLKTIISTAYNNGGKLTLFPIGENLGKTGMAEVLKTCVFKLGYEIENHTMGHERVFRLSEYEMAMQIWNQSQALNMTLGVNYEQHFFRLMGGDGSNDQRTHNYLKQLGFKGIADWSLSGSDATFEEIAEHLQPGAIYLFHTTDRDTKMLQKFIPYAVQQGYQLVTMNELLSFESNKCTQYSAKAMPLPQEYEEDYRTHKEGDYAWNVVRMQDKLRSLGILVMDGASTGYYGKQTAEAIQRFQQEQGLPATGVADSETQKRLLET